MGLNRGKMVTCKHCGAEIAVSAKLCPKCGGKNKKPIYKRWWFIACVVVVLISGIGAAGSSGSSSQSTGQTTVQEQKEEAVEITYTPYSVQELLDDLDANALKASEKYKNQYVELTGVIDAIDSSGAYISIAPDDGTWVLFGIQCDIQNEEQKAVIMEKSSGDAAVVKGKVTDVGDVLGYYLDIVEIR